MVQAVDGNWYGYFADLTQAQAADATSKVATVAGTAEGLDFGIFCDNGVTTNDADADSPAVTFGETSGVAFPFLVTDGGNEGTDDSVPAAGVCSTEIVDATSAGISTNQQCC